LFWLHLQAVGFKLAEGERIKMERNPLSDAIMAVISSQQHKRFFYSPTKLILALENRCFWKNGLEQNLRFDWVSDRTLCIQTSDGGYAFVVMVNGVAEVVKINSVGNIQWDRTFGEATFTYSIIQSSDDGYVLAGSTGGSGPSLGDNF
jgi:hypothetical protein